MGLVVLFDLAPGLFFDGGVGRRLVDTHVVDFELLRPDSFVYTLCTAPSAADGDIEQQVEGAVKGPLLVVGIFIGQAFVGEGEIAPVVDEEADFFGCPLGGVNVELRADIGERGW